MRGKLHLGVLGVGGGTAWVGTNRGTYLGLLAEQTGLLETVAVCDRQATHAERATAQLPHARAFTDQEAFFASGLDAVLIATPLFHHAAQAVAALEHGLAVLSEVTPVNSLVEAAQLAAAVERTGAFYMLAENYRYIDEVELLKRMADDRRFGRIGFAEGEYLHDVRDLTAGEDGAPTWRADLDRRGGLYCTHSLMPLLYITGDRAATVNCLEPLAGAGNSLMLIRTVAGRVFRIRVDLRSPRPHNMAYYALQGDRGAFEGARGLGDEAKVWLDGAHEPSKARRAHPGDPVAAWHPLRDFAPDYIPERLAAPEEAKHSGHFGADYWMLRDFARAVIEGRPAPIDVYRALDCCVPGIVALHSRANGGVPVPVPDFRPAAGDE